jgi:hypothetical protein
VFHKFKLSEQRQGFNLLPRNAGVMSGTPSFWREYFWNWASESDYCRIFHLSRLPTTRPCEVSRSVITAALLVRNGANPPLPSKAEHDFEGSSDALTEPDWIESLPAVALD